MWKRSRGRLANSEEKQTKRGIGLFFNNERFGL
jgi:hypothetical protein